MDGILLATQDDALAEEIGAAIAGALVIHRVRRGHDVVAAVAEVAPALVVLDFQIGNMGGVAACIALRQEEEAGRLSASKIFLLLDRKADEFLANQAGADGWLLKPLAALTTSRAINRALASPVPAG